MPKKQPAKRQQTIKTSSTIDDRIDRLIALYGKDKKTACREIERQARRVWLGYLFQSHKEVIETITVEEVEKRIYDPSVGEIVEVTKTTKTDIKTITPKVPQWAIKAALVRWESLSNFEEINAIQLLVESGIFPETVLDVIAEKTSGIPEALTISQNPVD